MEMPMAETPDSTRPGDWQCPNGDCINHSGFPKFFVFGTKVNCPKCGTGKNAQRPGDWNCPNSNCVNHQNCVYGSKPACTKCGTPRPPLNAKGGIQNNMMMNPGMPMMMPMNKMPTGGRGNGRAGDWHCANPACKNHSENVVYASKTHCPICGQEKPPHPQQPAPQQQMGFPQQMGMAQYPGAQGCGGCGGCGFMPQQQMMQGGSCGGKPARPGDWHCSNSACKNFRDNLVFGSKTSCPICGTPKPANAGMSGCGGGGYPMTHQVAPMMMMQGCMGNMGGMPMGGMGSMGGMGGMGGMTPRKRGQPGDWNCPNPACKNHRDNFVYASKSECPICHTAKPPDAGMGNTMRPGDWKCPNINCKNHINGVYGSKPMCTICGEVNPNTRERSRSPRRM